MLHIAKLIEHRWPQRSRAIVPALLALAALALLTGLALAVR